MTRISYERARSSSSAQAFSITGRSDSDPMRMPISGPVASIPGISCSNSAEVGVGVSDSDTFCLLGCAQSDVAAHLLAVEFDLPRARHGALAGERERGRDGGDAE